MSLNLSIPKIAITPEAEEDDDNNFLNLSEALTDIEELYDDTVSAKRHSYRKKLKIKVTDTDGYNTALEDIEASDDEDIVIIKQHSSPIALDSFDMEKYSTEEKIEISEKNSFNRQYLNMQSSTTNDTENSKKKGEGSNNVSVVTDVEDYDSENEIEENDNACDSDFHLNSYESIQATEISDHIQPRKQDFENAKVYPLKKKPPTFSQIMKAKAKSTANKSRRKKKSRVTIPKLNNPGAESSEAEVNEQKNRKPMISINSLNYESEMEEDVQLPFPICKKTFDKTKNLLHMPKCDFNNITDIEDVECDIDVSPRRISVDNSLFQKQLDEMASCYSFTKDKNEAKQPQCDEKREIIFKMNRNVEKKCKNEKNHSMVVVNNLFVDIAENEGATDVENIDSSSDNEVSETKNEESYFNDTEEEDFRDNLIIQTIEYPEVILPPPTRLLIVAEESKSLVPTVRIFPLDENFLEGSDIEIFSTDDESLNSVGERAEIGDFRILHSPQLPNFEGGLVSVSESCINSRHIMHNIEETGTDIEDLDEENKKYTKRREFDYTGQYLIPHTVSSLRTDLKEQDLTDDISGASMLSLLYSDNDNAFTDFENLESSDDEGKYQRYNESSSFNPQNMKMPILSIAGHIDSEDTIHSTDDEITYSRAETATPHESKKELDQSIQKNTEKSSKNDESEKVMYLKGGGFLKDATDSLEFKDDDEDIQLDNVMEAWEYFNHPSDKNEVQGKTEWCATKTDLNDVSYKHHESSKETQVSTTCQISSIPSVSYESVLSSPENSKCKNEYSQKIKSYAQIDAMLDKMLNEVDLINSSKDNCVNSFILEPSSDALIEIPIKKLKNEKTYTTTVDIFVSEDKNETGQLSDHSHFYSNCNSNKTQEKQCFSHSNELFVSPYKCDVLFGDSNKSSYDLETDLDFVENYNEPIDLNAIYQVEDKDNIWWEGTYRNLSVVLEEDEDNLSQTGKSSNAIYAGNIDQMNDFDYGEQHVNHENELDENFVEYFSDSSQMPSSISTDDSDNELRTDDNKARIKVLIKSQVGESNSVEIKSVKEIMSKQTENYTSPVIHEHPKKLTTLANKLSNILVNRKNNNYSTLPSINEKESKRSKKKPSFTLPRLFLKNSEAITCSSTICHDEIREKRHNIIAKPSEIFPLSFDHCATLPSEEKLGVDLYANIPFYPTYSCTLPISTSLPRKTQYIPPSDVIISEAYCNWSSEIDSIGIATSPQYLDKLEGKLLDKTIDTCVVEFSNTEITKVCDFEQTLNEINAFLKFESKAEPYDVLTDIQLKNFKSEIESTSNATPHNKKLKKGIFRTLKSFITKSTEHLDTETDRFTHKKDDRENENVSTVPTRSMRSDDSIHESGNGSLIELVVENGSENADNKREDIGESNETKWGSSKENLKTKTQSKNQNVTYQQDQQNKETETNVLRMTEYFSINDQTQTEDCVDEMQSAVAVAKCGDIEIMQKENQSVPENSPKQLEMPKKSGFWSFLSKKPKKTNKDENETNARPEKLSELHFDELRVTNTFLQREKNNYDCVLQPYEIENQKNEPNIRSEYQFQDTCLENSEIPRSSLSKLKLTDYSSAHTDPSYITFGEYDLANEPMNIASHEKQKKVTFQENVNEGKQSLEEADDKNSPQTQRLICRLKANDADLHASNIEVFSEGGKGQYEAPNEKEVNLRKTRKNQVVTEMEKGINEQNIESFYPVKLLEKENILADANIVSVTDNLHDVEFETPIFSTNETVMKPLESLATEIPHSRTIPGNTNFYSPLDKQERSRDENSQSIKTPETSIEILEIVRETGHQSEALFMGDSGTKSDDMHESVKTEQLLHSAENRIIDDFASKNKSCMDEKNRKQYLNEELKILCAAFITNEIGTDSSSNDKIPTQRTTETKNERLSRLFGKKKTFPEERESDDNNKKCSLSANFGNLIEQKKEGEEDENDILSKKVESEEKQAKKGKNISKGINSKLERIFKIFDRKRNGSETLPRETENQIEMPYYESITLTSDLIEITNEFLKNEKITSNESTNCSRLYQRDKEENIIVESNSDNQEALHHINQEYNSSLRKEVFLKMLNNKFQGSGLPEEIAQIEDNRKRKDFICSSNQTDQYPVPSLQEKKTPIFQEIEIVSKKDETDGEPSLNVFSSTNDFLAPEKEFNHVLNYLGGNSFQDNLEAEGINDRTLKENTSNQHDSNEQKKTNSRTSSEKFGDDKISENSPQKTCPVESKVNFSTKNNLRTENFIEPKSGYYCTDNIDTGRQNYIQSTDIFLQLERDSYYSENYKNEQYETNYSLQRQDLRIDDDRQGGESNKLPKQQIMEEESIIPEETPPKRRFESDLLNVNSKNSTAESCMIENISFQETIESTSDFLSTERMLYHDRQNVIDDNGRSQKSTLEEECKSIDSTKSTYPEKKIPDTRSRRFLKMFGIKSDSRVDKIEEKIKKVDIIEIISTAKFLEIERKCYDYVDCSTLRQKQLEMVQVKDKRSKGIFKIFSRKSEEKDKVDVESQGRSKFTVSEKLVVKTEMPSTKKQNIQTDESVGIFPAKSNTFEKDDLFTNSKDLSRATDVFLKTERYYYTECNEFNSGSKRRPRDDTLEATEVVIEEKQRPEKTGKRKHIYKIFHRKSEDEKTSGNIKVHEYQSEKKTKDCRDKADEYSRNQDPFDIFSKKSKSLEKKNMSDIKTEELNGSLKNNMRGSIQMTREFLHEEKKCHHDECLNEPITKDFLINQTECAKSDRENEKDELSHRKPKDESLKKKDTPMGHDSLKQYEQESEPFYASIEVPEKHIIVATNPITKEEKHVLSANSQILSMHIHTGHLLDIREKRGETTESKIVENTRKCDSEIEIRDQFLKKKEDNQIISKDETDNQNTPEELNLNYEKSKERAKGIIDNTHSLAMNRTEGNDGIQENNSPVNSQASEDHEVEEPEQKSSKSKQESLKKKLKSKSIATELVEKGHKNAGILGLCFRRSKSKEKRELSRDIQQRENKKVSFMDLQACKLFLEKEIEMYFGTFPALESKQPRSTPSEEPEEKNIFHLHSSAKRSKESNIFDFFNKIPKSDNEKITEKVLNSQNMINSADFIQKEVENYQDVTQAKTIPLEKNILETQTFESALSMQNEKIEDVKEYTAFDFIEEEVNNFNKSAVRFADTIDSSFRVETEIEQVGGKEPKEIIKKKITISEKQIEIPGQSNCNSGTSDAILTELVNMHESHKNTMKQQPVDKRYFKLSTDTSDISKLPQKTKENIGNIQVEFVQKMRDLELAKGDVIEDVSLLEKKIVILPHNSEEKITDLDEILPNELIVMKKSILDTNLETIPVVISESIEKRVELNPSDVARSRLLDTHLNETAKENKMAVTKLNDKASQFQDLPANVRVTENLVKELDIQYHRDQSLLSKNKNIASLPEVKTQVIDGKPRTILQNKNMRSGLDENDYFETIEFLPSETDVNYSSVASHELTEEIYSDSFTSQEKTQNQYVANEIEDTAKDESSTHEKVMKELRRPHYSERKPLFRIESDEDDSVAPVIAKDIKNVQYNICDMLTDYSPDSKSKLISEDTFAVDSRSDTRIIEDKLRDLGKALDELERLSEITSDGKNELEGKKLRRVERKFERMASETLEPMTYSEQGIKSFNPAENDCYQELVSHLSTHEVISFQNEYNNLWDEYTFSKSDEWDSKTPESQADVLELPQDTCKQLTEASQNSSTNIQTPQPMPRHQKSKDTTEEHIISSELHVKQISPVRDDLLDENERSDRISYSDKKKFWENISKYPQKQLETVEFKKRKSIGEASTIPIPKPRGGLQFSYSLAVTDNEKSSLMEYTEGDSIPSGGADEMTLKEFLEHDFQLSESSEEQKLEAKNQVSLMPCSEITTDMVHEIKTVEEKKSPDDSSTSNEKTLLKQSELPKKDKSDENNEAQEKHIGARVEKSESADSDTEGSGQNSSQGGDNAGYISDSGDVEHYISDSEIEDRVPQIRERQMSVFVAPSVSQRTRYERSASLPTEDLYEISARNTKSRKLYYEDQIKKEMIKEQLTIDLEDDISPERKSIGSSSHIVESKDEQEKKQLNTRNYTDEEVHDDTQVTKMMDETSIELNDFNPTGKSLDSVIHSAVSETIRDNESILLENKIYTEYIGETSSTTEEEKKMIRQIDGRTDEEYIEIHVDKSETEKSEKSSDKLNADLVDIQDTSFNQLEKTPALTVKDTNVQSITAEQPTITVTLSGIQKRISEEDDPYADKTDCKIMNSTSQYTEKTVCSSGMQEENNEKDDQYAFHLNNDGSSRVNSNLEMENQIINDMTFSKQIKQSEDTQTNFHSVVYQCEENIDSTVWEVSVESEILTEEKLSSLPSIPKAIPSSSVNEKMGATSGIVKKQDEDMSSELQDDFDISPKVHHDHSDPYSFNQIKSESHCDMKKIILDSLHQQKVDPEEAKIIANSLISEIESEIQNVENFNEELRNKSDSHDFGNQHVTNYLKKLADAKCLDQREVELVESILERRQQQISKLTRGDTQASSMEITDEDLRYSEGDMDYTHVLEQQIDQLKAEYSDNLKTEYDTLVDDQNVLSANVDRLSNEGFDGKYGTDNQNINKGIIPGEVTVMKLNEASIDETTYSHFKNVIMEEDENISETITEDMNKTAINSQPEVKENSRSEEKKTIYEKFDDTVESRDTEYVTTAIKEAVRTASLEEIEDISEKIQSSIGSLDSAGEKEKNLKILNKDELKFSAEQKISNSMLKQETIGNGMNTIDFQRRQETQLDLTTSFKPEYELVSKVLTPQSEHLENDTQMSEKIVRTSSSDSKSSSGSTKSPDLFTISSFDKKLESESFQDVVLRQSISGKECYSTKSDKKAGNEVESYSSSGESHYHSFEIEGKSRPCSSDVEGIIPTGSSEYESALNSQDLSARSQLTSGEYHTAISSLSSKESMKSFESESSGNLASIEISEASETLVPTNSDLEGDVDIIVDQRILDECELLWPINTEDTETNFDQEKDFTEYFNNSSKDSEIDSDQLVEIQSKMKRSYEMTFQPEPIILTEDSPHTESNDIEEKFGSSLDEGSVLSVSLSSTSSAQLKTVIELSRNESGGPEESLTTSVLSDQMSLEEFDSILKSVDNISTTLTMHSSHEGIEPNYTVNQQSDSQKFSHDDLKKKGHRRHESSSFIQPPMHGITKLSEPQSLTEEIESVTERNETELFIHGAEEIREQNMDLSIKREFTERRDSHGKSSTTSSEKSSFEEAEAEAAFSMVAHISPVHKIKQICPIIEDIDAEKSELEAKKRLELEKEYRTSQVRDASPGSIPDIKVTEHLAPLDESNFRYPELEMERKELEQEVQKTVESETPVSNSSKSSEETDQGQDYILEDDVTSEIKALSDSKSEISTVVQKTTTEEERVTDSPNSDSFELIEKPDIIDDFVVIEEVGKEANEMDSEGKSVNIQSKPKRIKKHDEDIDAYLAKSDPTPLTKMTELKYFPDNSNDDLDFEFEDSPPQRKFGAEKSKDYGLEYDKELEANRKWIEQQFHGDQAAMAAAGYGYEMEFERGPLEDIKEEDINDIDLASSRIGSLGSQKESGGSMTSVKDSYSSTPDYDVLAGRKYFTKSGEHDDISMSSLQEFENLERAMSLETKKFHHGSGSQDSSSNGSFKTRYYANKAQGDDISVSSLKEFEGLEKACIAVHKTEIKVKEEEELLSQIDERKESLTSKSEKDEQKPISFSKEEVVESEDGDYEKRIFEINQIIRQAQNNVERFIDLKETDKTESLGRGDSIEEVSKVPDLDLDAPIAKSKSTLQWEEDDPMITSTDSLDMNQERPAHHDSTDSLEQKNNDRDIMTASTDSIEISNQMSKGNFTADSMDIKAETSRMVCSDSLEMPVVTTRLQEDSLEEDEPKICHDYSSSDTGKDFSSSAKEDAGEHDEHLHELMLGSTDSLEPTSSAATHATYQYESDSVFSGSFTSGGSNTMVSSTDTIDPAFTNEHINISAAASKAWFDKKTDISEKNVTFEYFGEPSEPYVTEVIEPSEDPSCTHTIHRSVQLPPEVRKIIFRGKDADENLQRFINDFEEGEHVQETEDIDASGNIHIKRVVQKRYIIKPDDIESSFPITSCQHVPTQVVAEKKTTGMALTQLTALTKSLTGDAPPQHSESPDISTHRAQASRRRPLRYDISIEDQTEVDPREHDWRFDLYKYEQSPDSTTEEPDGQFRTQIQDQHQLSEEMKKLLEKMENTNKQ